MPAASKRQAKPSSKHQAPNNRDSSKDIEREFHNRLDFEERQQASDYLSKMHEQIDMELDVAAKRALLKVGYFVDPCVPTVYGALSSLTTTCTPTLN